MMFLDVFNEKKQIQKFQIGLYSLQMNTIMIKRKVASDFHIYFCKLNVNVHARKTVYTEHQRMWHSGGFWPEWRPHYFIEYKAISKIFCSY